MILSAIGPLLALIVQQGGQPQASPLPTRHLVYEFGNNTPVASQGTGTGTMTVDISAPLPDSGVMVSATDTWWNAIRPAATNACEVYRSGDIACRKRPYAMSPMQLTLFPMLSGSFFSGLEAGGLGKWQTKYTADAAVVPGAAGMAGNPYVWNCVFELQGKGPIVDTGTAVIIEAAGKLEQTSGRYLTATSTEHIAYDPSSKIPIAVSDVRTYFPQTSIYNADLVELKLVRGS
jgi:hypothetical protein